MWKHDRILTVTENLYKCTLQLGTFIDIRGNILVHFSSLDDYNKITPEIL